MTNAKSPLLLSLMWTLTVLSTHAQFGPPIEIAPDMFGGLNGPFEAVDMDSDGDLDLVFKNNTSLVWVQNLDGEGNFGTLIELATVATHFAIGDVEGDGDLDIVLVDGNGQVQWLPNLTGSGTFGPPQLVCIPADAVDVLICADLNGDDLPEVAYTTNVAGEAAVQVAINLGGAFAPQLTTPFGIGGNGLRLLSGDMDQDSVVDLMTLDGDGTIRMLWNVSGDAMNWEFVEILTTQPEALLFLVDVEGDGDLDILITGSGLLQWAENSSTPGTVPPFVEHEVYPDVFGNHWGYPAILGCGSELSIIHTRGLSFNLYWTQYDPVVGAFSLTPPDPLISSFGGSTILNAADLNGDGRQDLLHIKYGTGLRWYPNELPVEAEPDEVTLNPFDILCEFQSPYELDQATPASGQWTGPGVEGNVFDPSLAGVGTFTLTYQVATPCPLRAEAEIIVQPSIPDGIILTPFDTLCVTGTAYALDGFATPSGGTWSGPGVEDNVFTPSGVGTFELSYTSTEACGIVQSSIEVVATPSIELVSGEINNPCGTDPLVFEATPPGGTWSGIAQAGGVVERSCSERPDQGYVTYTFNAVNGGNCSANANYFTLQACASVSLGPDTTMCSNDALLVLSVGGGNVFGSLSGMDSVVQEGPGVIGFFSPQKEPGVYTIIGQASGAMACPNADTLLVTIIAQPQITTGAYGPLCSTAAPAALGGTPSNGTWAGAGVSGEQFNPAIAGPGAWTLTYTVTEGSCTNSDSTTIVVNAAPNAGIGGSVEVCATSAPINLFTYLQGNPQEGGLWSYQFGATSGTFVPGVSPEGTYTYTATGAGPCTSVTAQLEVNVMDLQLDPILAPDTDSIPGTYIFSALPVLIDADSIVWSFSSDWSWGNDPDHFDGEALLVPPETVGVYFVCATAYGGDGCIGIEQCFQVIVTGIAAHGTTGPRMAIYPNPNNGQFTISMNGSPTTGRVMVLDAMGKQLLQQRMIGGASTMQMDLGDLASGMYHVRIETEREVVSLPMVVGR